MPSRRRRFRARPKPEPKKPPANQKIAAPQVRLIGVNGEQLGVIDTKEAMRQAQEEDLDLVLVAQKADPPVARLLDLGKYVYEKRKADAKQRAHSKSGGVKGIRLGFKTDEHDWEMRAKQAAHFLEEGNKVKVEMRLRGREKQRFDQAREKIERFVRSIPVKAEAEGGVSRSHNSLSVVVARA